jgi:hypothetical protein
MASNSNTTTSNRPGMYATAPGANPPAAQAARVRAVMAARRGTPNPATAPAPRTLFALPVAPAPVRLALPLVPAPGPQATPVVAASVPALPSPGQTAICLPYANAAPLVVTLAPGGLLLPVAQPAAPTLHAAGAAGQANRSPAPTAICVPTALALPVATALCNPGAGTPLPAGSLALPVPTASPLPSPPARNGATAPLGLLLAGPCPTAPAALPYTGPLPSRRPQPAPGGRWLRRALGATLALAAGAALVVGTTAALAVGAALGML